MTAESRTTDELRAIIGTRDFPPPVGDTTPFPSIAPESAPAPAPADYAEAGADAGSTEPEPEEESQPDQEPEPSTPEIGGRRLPRRKRDGEKWEDQNIRRTFHLPRALLLEADDHAARLDLTLSAAVREALQTWVEKQRKTQRSAPVVDG